MVVKAKLMSGKNLGLERPTQSVGTNETDPQIMEEDWLILSASIY